MLKKSGLPLGLAAHIADAANGGPQSDLRMAALPAATAGPRTAAAVAQGRCRLIGLVYADDAGVVRCATVDIATVLRGFGLRLRLYRDALFGRAIEYQNGLPHASEFEDTDIQERLLEVSPSQGPPAHDVLTSCNSDQAAISASVERVQQLATVHRQRTQELISAGLDGVYHHLELPLVAATQAMISNGVHVNMAMLREMINQSESGMAAARNQLCHLAGHLMNPDSPQQLHDLVFTQLRLPVVAWTKKGDPSTDKRMLERLAGTHPVIDILGSYRHYQNIRKLGAQILPHAAPGTARVHCSLDPLGTDTGRLNCKEPNMQRPPQ